MTVPTVACTNCGKNFTTDDLRGTNCRYCGTLLAHHARAAQQVAVVNQMLADRNGNGIPDAYEGLVANAQANAMNQAFGVAPGPYGSPHANPYAQQPMMYPGMQAAVQVQAATRSVTKIILIVTLVIVGMSILLTVGGALLAFFLARPG